MTESGANIPTRLFISYASEDEECAQILKIFLQSFHSVEIFAASNIMAGKPFFETITNALKTFDCIIVLISRDSIDIPWIAFEVGAFIARGKAIALLGLETFTVDKFRTPLKNLQVRKLDSINLRDIINSFSLNYSNNLRLDQEIVTTINKLNSAVNKKYYQGKLALRISEKRPDIHETEPTMRHIDVTNNHEFRWADRCRAYMTSAMLDNRQAAGNWEKLKRCLLKWEHRKEYFIEIPSGETRTLDAFTFESSKDGNRYVIGRNSSIDVFAQEMHIEVSKNEHHQIRIEYLIVDDDFGTSRFWIEINLKPNQIPNIQSGPIDDF